MTHSLAFGTDLEEFANMSPQEALVKIKKDIGKKKMLVGSLSLLICASAAAFIAVLDVDAPNKTMMVSTTLGACVLSMICAGVHFAKLIKMMEKEILIKYAVSEDNRKKSS